MTGDPIIDALESTTAFKVYADCENYPDVEFEIMLDTLPSMEQAELAVRTLDNFVNRYNKWHFFRPIHYVSGLEDCREGNHPWGIYVFIDFGGSSPKALLEAVRALEATDLPIVRLTLR